jgi:hypothetical protein
MRIAGGAALAGGDALVVSARGSPHRVAFVHAVRVISLAKLGELGFDGLGLGCRDGDSHATEGAGSGSDNAVLVACASLPIRYESPKFLDEPAFLFSGELVLVGPVVRPVVFTILRLA